MSELFRDRSDAGRRLAERLEKYRSTDAVVLAIPLGGVPIAAEVSCRLGLPLDFIILRKLPIPWNPEAGFGAVTSDGALVLNEAIVKGMGLSKKLIKSIANGVMEDIQNREHVLRDRIPKQAVRGKQVIIVDDGLASGYTMLAAVQSARQSGAGRVTVAVPVASESAIRLIGDAADEIICIVESHRLPFAVADYYLTWHDLTDEEVMDYLPAAVT
ncbi:MAG: phosphoribosyltransferase family protein [Armatimonadota bacterium]